MGAECEVSPDSADIKIGYRRYTKRKVVFIMGCAIVAFFALGLSIYIGASDIGFLQVYELLYKHLIGTVYEPGTTEYYYDFLVWNVRLPRALFALIAGAGLAVGGAVMQSVMKNPLADPYTTGISQGTCFGVAVSIVLGMSLTGSYFGGLGFVLNTFIFALIPMFFIMLISPLSNSSPATLILSGVALSYIFNALTTVLLISTDAETLAVVYRWQIGSLSDISWNSVPIMFVSNAIGMFVLSVFGKKLNILATGDDSAKSLGLNANNMRIMCLMIISFMIASVVSYVGIISFIGLISAHIIRILIDSDNKFVIPASAVFGAVFLLCSDMIARFLSPIDAIPVGVVLSFIGAPIFLFLIIRQKRSMW